MSQELQKDKSQAQMISKMKGNKSGYIVMAQTKTNSLMIWMISKMIKNNYRTNKTNREIIKFKAKENFKIKKMENNNNAIMITMMFYKISLKKEQLLSKTKAK